MSFGDKAFLVYLGTAYLLALAGPFIAIGAALFPRSFRLKSALWALPIAFTAFLTFGIAQLLQPGPGINEVGTQDWDGIRNISIWCISWLIAYSGQRIRRAKSYGGNS